MMAEQRDNTAEGAEQAGAKTASAGGAPPDLDVLDQALGPMNLKRASEPLGDAAGATPKVDDDGIPGVQRKPAVRDSRAMALDDGSALAALESDGGWDVALGAPSGGASAPLTAPVPSGQVPGAARASNGAREAAAVLSAARGSSTAATPGTAPVDRPAERQVVAPMAYAAHDGDSDGSDQEATLVDLRRQMLYTHPIVSPKPPDGVGRGEGARGARYVGEVQEPDAAAAAGAVAEGNGAAKSETREKPKGMRSVVSAMRIISVGDNEAAETRLSRDSVVQSVSKRHPWKSDEVNGPITPRLGQSVGTEGADDELEPLSVEGEESTAGTHPIGIPRPYPRAQDVVPTAAAMARATSGVGQDNFVHDGAGHDPMVHAPMVHDGAGMRGLGLETAGDAASADGGGPNRHGDAGHADAGRDDAGHDDEELEPEEEDDGVALSPVTLPRRADEFDDEKTLVRGFSGASFQGSPQVLGARTEPAQASVSLPMAPVATPGMASGPPGAAVPATQPEFAPPMGPSSQMEMPISVQDLVDVGTEEEPLDLEPESHDEAAGVQRPPFGQMRSPTLPLADPAPGLTPPPVPTRAALSHDETPSPPVSADAASGVHKRRKGRQGWEIAFADEFSRAFRKLTPRQLDAEVSFIERSLGIQQGGVLLDLGCGHGQHAVELASRGYNVVGFDLSLTMLAMASDEAHERQQKINFLHGDMRDMAFDQLFDGVYCWSTSFGFFDDETNIQVIHRIHRALRSGGMFLLDMVNRDYICARLPSLVWFEGDGCVCIDDAQFNSFTSRIRVKRTIVTDDGISREVEYTVRLYSLHEIGRIMHEVGFKVVEVSGHPASAGAFFDAESPRLITLAVRR